MKRREKNLIKRNKKEGIEDQCSSIWIGNFHSLLSNANSLVIHKSFKYLFTDSSYVKFDRSLFLFSLSVHLITPLRIGVFADFRWICLNHLKQYYTSFSSTDATSVSHVCHHFGPDLFLCDHKFIVAYASQLWLVAGHITS
jgi:hypothetical protein